jgi:hypothetical protein
MSSEARWPIPVAIIVVIALFASLFVIALDREADDNPVTAAIGPDGTDPSTPTDPPADPADLEATVAELSAFVEEARGLEFREPVDVEVLADDEFEARLLEEFESDDVAEIQKLEVLLKALAVIEPSDDLVELYRDLVRLAVLGFYDPENDELVVRGASATPFVRTSIVHELTHALDDQHYDLHRPEFEEATDEVGFGHSAVVEGNARRIENEYRDQLSDEDSEDLAREEAAFAADAVGELMSVPLLLVFLVQAPYEEGPDLVEAVLDEGGEDALAAAFDDPPHTSDEVIDPERYLAEEGAVDVPRPEPDAVAVDEGVLGRMFIALVLNEALPGDEAWSAAEGWGGDWATWWEEGGESCVRFALAGDTSEDTDRFEAALRDWADVVHPDAQIARDEVVTLTACA